MSNKFDWQAEDDVVWEDLPADDELQTTSRKRRRWPFLLLIVLLPGVGYTVNGSTRWVRIGVMNLQVSEPARLCLLMYLAGYLVRRNK